MKYKLLGSNDYTFDMVGQIAINRGVEDISALLSVSEKDCHSPWLLNNMQSAVDLLKKHQEKNSKVHIITDSDFDGCSSATIMYLYLKDCGFTNITWNNHPKKKHGIIMSELEGFDFDLLIVPDAGSDNLDEHKVLKEKGIDVLVIDHHPVERITEDAVLINPKMDDYPNKEICGAVVVYKVCQAFDLTNGTNYADKYLDLVAMGCIADMMDTRIPETRYFCTEGLKKINNKMLKALIEKQKFKMGDDLTIVGVQFYIAPLVNSLFRSGTLDELDKMFTGFITDYEVEVDYKKRGVGMVKVSLHSDIAREMGLIKDRQDKNKKKLMQPILDIVEEQQEDKIHIIDVSNVEDPEMLGLIANDLAKKQQRPVLLVKEKDGLLRGSGRNYGRFEITELKSFLKQFNFNSLDGHENAFGVSLGIDDIDRIREEIAVATKDITTEESFFVDFIMEQKELDKKMIKTLDKLKPLWGNSFEEPYILVKNIKASDVVINEKLTMLSWTNAGIKYVIFNPSENQINLLLEKGSTINAIGRGNLNTWLGETTSQFTIEEFEVTKSEEKEMWF